MQKIILLFVLGFYCNAFAQKPFYKAKKNNARTIDVSIFNAVQQYKYLQQNIPENKFPRTYYQQKNQYEWSNSGWWCSGFYPGTLINLYKLTNDTSLLVESKRMLNILKKEQFNTTTHDLGFMMYCSFGILNALQHNNNYDSILYNSAKSLASRFNKNVGCIKSWDGKPNEYLVIIDNMMNLKLLFWATQFSGDSSFYKIAVTHANTTMLHHFRNDYSSYHVLNYNATTGEVMQKKTAQGYANESAWARGQAWALYGYTETFRETNDKKYLVQAQKIANFILQHPNLPNDKIPYWDFNTPQIPNELRDASAAAIMASAFLDLSNYVSKKDAKKYFKVAETIILKLSTNEYLANLNTNGGYILKHSVGNKPKNSEVDVPLTYADYYYVEAMLRYKQLTNKNFKIFQ